MKKAVFVLFLLAFALSINSAIPITTKQAPKLFFYENLTGSWGNQSIEIRPLISVEGKITSLSEKLSAQTTVLKTRDKYKWTITAQDLTGTTLSKVDSVYFDIITNSRVNSLYSESFLPYGNVSKYPFEYNRSIVAKSFFERGLVLDFQDIIKAGYVIEKVNNTRWKVTNLRVLANSLILDPDIEINYCQELSESANNYILTEDLADDTCLIISGANINLDCNNHYINYGISAPGFGIWVTNTGDFTTIENCNILDNGFGTDAIYDEGRATTVRHSNLYTYETASSGINAVNVSQAVYELNTIQPAGFYSPAIRVTNSTNVTIRDSTLYAGMLGYDGGVNVFLTNANATTIKNNTLFNEGIIYGTILHGILAQYSYNLEVSNNYFNYGYSGDVYTGIECQFCKNVNFTNNLLNIPTDYGNAIKFENTSANMSNNTMNVIGYQADGLEGKKSNLNIDGLYGTFRHTNYALFVYSTSTLNASRVILYDSGGGYVGGYVQVTNYNITDSVFNIFGGVEAGFETNFLSGNCYIRNLTVVTNSSSYGTVSFLRVLNLVVYDSNFTSLQTIKPGLHVLGGGNTDNVTFVNSFLSGFTNESVFLTTGANYLNLSFINVTFNLSKTWFKVDGVANLSVYYPIAIKVFSNLGGVLDNATTNLTNGVSALVFQNVKTDLNGETPWTTYLIYKKNGSKYFNNLNWFYAGANRTRYSVNFTNQSISNGTSFIIVTLIRTAPIESFNNAYFLMSSMLEPIIVIGIIVFLFAFLYYATPKENQAFKTFFLMLSIFTVLVLLWLGAISTSSSVAIQRYDEGNTYMGMDIVNTTNTEAKNTLMGFTEVYVYIPYILLILLFVIFIYNAFIVEYLNQRRERNEGDI